MTQSKTYYQAVSARDSRFDGLFFVGVTSTGIYCRPVCTAKTPKKCHCRFFPNAMMAEKKGFRPCLRCRPELAPGNAPIDDAHRIAHFIVQRIEEGLAGNAGIEAIAAQFELSSRQIRRIVQKELGVSPIELILTRRLLMAKQLLTETKLPVTEIAFASGFASLRRFNDAFSKRYGMPPSRLRRQAKGEVVGSSGTSTLRLGYRPPYDWQGILAFLKTGALKGVEHVTDEAYLRTVCLGKNRGWIKVTHLPDKNTLKVEFTHSLTPVLPALLSRLRNLFDLSARPDLIAEHLRKDKRLKPMVDRNPGLRIPGAFDGFELAVRAVLGQQMTVKAAMTLAWRLTGAFAEKYAATSPELSHLSLAPERLSTASVDDIVALGIVASHARGIIALAKAVVEGVLTLEARANPDEIIAQLTELPGIGPWTAHYIAMRALCWPDAFMKEDVAVLNRLGGITPKQAEAMSQNWRPWRSYAVLHLWRNQA